MKRYISLFLSITAIIISFVLPFILDTQNSDFSVINVLYALTALLLVTGMVYLLLSIISKRQIKGTIFIANHFSDIEFAQELVEKLKKSGYRCYPEISELISGTKIKDLNLDLKLKKSELLIVLLSNDSSNSGYIKYSVKNFKTQNKPIQIYTFGRIDVIPEYLKQYIIFPLPKDKSNALTMILKLVNGLFLGKRIRGKN